MKVYIIWNLQDWPAGSVFLGVFLVYIVGAIAVPVSLNFTIVYSCVWMGLWMINCWVICYHAVRKLALRNLVVSLTAESVVVQSTRSADRVFLLRDIASYMYYQDGDDGRFWFRLYSGSKITFVHSAIFCPEDDFQTFVAEFECQQHVSASSASGEDITSDEARKEGCITREKTFYEKPIADAIGWMVVFVLICLSGYSLANSSSQNLDSVLPCYANGLLYLGAWLNGRKVKRKE